MRAAADTPVVFGDASRRPERGAAVCRCADEDVADVVVDHAAPADVHGLCVGEGDRRTAAWTHVQSDANTFFERLAAIRRPGYVERGRTGLALPAVTTVQPRRVNRAVRPHGQRVKRLRGRSRRIDGN